MKYILDFYSFVKFFISFYFTSKFNYKISKIIDEKQYRNLQTEYLFKGELIQILQFENENNYSITILIGNLIFSYKAFNMCVYLLKYQTN